MQDDRIGDNKETGRNYVMANKHEHAMSDILEGYTINSSPNSIQIIGEFKQMKNIFYQWLCITWIVYIWIWGFVWLCTTAPGGQGTTLWIWFFSPPITLLLGIKLKSAGLGERTLSARSSCRCYLANSLRDSFVHLPSCQGQCDDESRIAHAVDSRWRVHPADNFNASCVFSTHSSWQRNDLGPQLWNPMWKMLSVPSLIGLVILAEMPYDIVDL